MSTIEEERANRLLNDPVFKETLDALEQELKTTWYNSGIRETEAREHFFEKSSSYHYMIILNW